MIGRAILGMMLWWISQLALAVTVPVPDALQPWKDWALFGEETARCPFYYQDFANKQCQWPGQLQLNVETGGLRFEQDWRLYTESTLALPGSEGFWPGAVTVNGKPATVVEQNNRPFVRLPAGQFHLAGLISFSTKPDSLLIPVQTALVQLKQQGVAVPNPRIDADGRLWLVERQNAEPADTGASEDKLNIRVFRHLVDDIPFRLETLIELEVGGKPREMQLGKVLFTDFTPTSFASPLPARIDADGTLRVQVRPGQWTLRIDAHRNGAVEQLTLETVAEKLWPEDEIWVFETLPDLRQIRVEGVDSIDPSQTSLPGEWQQFPAYRLQAGNSMTFAELRRGDPQPSPNQLALERQFWLDFDGAGLTVRDRFSGSLYRDWRLTAQPELQLGSLELNGAPQVITTLETETGTTQGVEVRSGSLQASALSRMAESGGLHVRSLSSTGWQHDVDQLNATLQLPPGWRVFTVTGVEQALNTWTGSWNVWDIFIVLIAIVAVIRLRGIVPGAICALALVLIYPEASEFLYLWLNVIAVMAILFFLPEGKLRIALRWYGSASALLLALWFLSFMVDQARLGLYPQLQQPWTQMGQGSSYYGGYGDSNDYAANAVAPSAAPMEMAMDAAMEAESGMKQESLRSLAKLSSPRRPEPKKREPNIERSDPNLAAQTGPGQPNWEWMQTTLYWNGPVTQGEQFNVYLLTPWENRLLAWLRVILGVAMLASVLGLQKIQGHWKIAGWRPRAVASAAALVLMTVLPPAAPNASAADIPDEKILETLKKRLLEERDCTPACLGIERTHLLLNGNRLTVRFSVHAQQDLFWPLPDSQQQWRIDSVQLDDQPHVARKLQGSLQLPVSAGTHTLQLSGTVNPQREFQLTFPVMPHNLTVSADGWDVRGLDNGRLQGNGLYFYPAARAAQTADAEEKQLTPDPLPPFVQVRRDLRLGLNWYLETTVERVAPEQGGITLEIPLLPGESITTQDIEVNAGKARIQLKPGQDAIAWTSTLDKTNTLTLQAAENAQWSEHWSVDPSPLWHISVDGIAPVKETGVVGQWRPRWRPYPGEKIVLNIARPEAVAGATTTIDQVQQTWTPGLRESRSVVKLHLVSSKGSEQHIELPQGAQVKQVTVDEEARAADEDSNKVIVPVNPGQHWIEVEWRQPEEHSVRVKTPAVAIGAPYVNHGIQVQMPQDRWVLFAGGPAMGPAILFWGVTLVTLLVAVVLGRFRQLPLKTVHWVLLVLGLCAGWIQAMIPIALWFFAMHRRSQLSPQKITRTQFNLLQLFLAGFSLFVFAVLIAAIPNGLLGSPDMGVTGNGSTQYQLNWFVDRGENALTQAWVISIPLWIYRALMLVWSLWLALHLLSWLKWGWQAFTHEGYWRSDVIVKEKPAAKEKSVVVQPGQEGGPQ